jgi:hypothetical protein
MRRPRLAALRMARAHALARMLSSFRAPSDRRRVRDVTPRKRERRRNLVLHANKKRGSRVMCRGTLGEHEQWKGNGVGVCVGGRE